ncbi:MAG: hypothetical protein OXL40_14245 [Bacteroidota bacterium]|nr:hypothetical protein [Bacteroidota bacterium]
MIFCLSPLTLLAERLVITPADVTVEEAASAEFAVMLSSAPTGDVTVTVMRPNGTDPSLDTTSLTFTQTNWSVPQQVSMMVGEDADFADDADRLILIAIGGGYGGGGALGKDPDFFHPSRSVGVWGFDSCDSTLISLTFQKDVVGYCYDQGWLSDYVHEDVINYRERVEGTRARPLVDATHESDMLILWGGVQGGGLRIEPLFSASVPSQLPEVDGPYQREGFGADVILFSLSFTLGQNKFGNKDFLFATPVGLDLEESLDRIVLTGPEGSVAIGADDQRTSSVFRDVRTGKVRGILRYREGDLSVMPAQGLTDSIRQRRLVLFLNHNIQIEILGK